ncbi:helix-turn-helix domain-containing protein [Spirillospora sp. CA-294931]|uniref:helix-turn-helix domain-containing protein n=1 Tax=Spirillospora sp. CA-294931 TaxID=3240042 RepID=UPI003D8C625A
MGNWEAVADVINTRMKDRGITQRELAEKSGVSPATLRQIQKGEPRQRSRSTLAAISRALGFPDDRLRDISVRVDLTNASGDDADPPLSHIKEEISDLRKRVEALEANLPKEKAVE